MKYDVIKRTSHAHISNVEKAFTRIRTTQDTITFEKQNFYRI